MTVTIINQAASELMQHCSALLRIGVVILLTIFSINSAFAETISIYSSAEAISLSPASRFFADKTRSLTVQDVARLPELFQPVSGSIPHFGFTSSAIWLRCSVRNPGGQRIFLQVYNAPLDTLDVYIRRADGTFYHKHYGAASRFQATGSIYPVVELGELDTARREAREILIRAVSYGVMYLPIEIAGTEAVMRSSLNYSWINAVAFAVIFTMIAYNLFIFFTVRQRSYLLYVLYGLSVSIFFAYQKGYVTFLLGDMLAGRLYALPVVPDIMVLLPTILICLFAISFLRLHEILPKMHKFMLGLVLLFAIIVIAESLTGFNPAKKVLSFLVMISSLSTLLCGILALRQGYSPARFYLIGWGAWLVSTIVYALLVEKILPTTRFIEVVLQIGAVSESVLMSFALGDRINLLQKNLFDEQQRLAISERERELEHIRNEELEKANEQIRRQSGEINDYNLSIEAANEELQQINQQLGEQQKLLEHRARENEMMNARLQRQNQQLQTLNDEKNEFLGIAAHDLKNPLTGLRGMLEILDTDDDLSKDYRKRMLVVMRQSVERMFDIVSKFLDVNALEEGAILPHPENLALMALVQSVVGNYALPAADKQIRINVSGNERTEAFADQQLVLQVLDNLVSNAVKYSHFGASVKIAVLSDLPDEIQEKTILQNALDRTQNPHEILQGMSFVLVQDYGQGLTQEDRQKLFQKFARLSAKPTGGEHSTGLGLSIAKKLADAMEGELWCVSEAGHGSSFILALPRKASSDKSTLAR